MSRSIHRTEKAKVRQILVAARWEAETVFLYADLYGQGVLPATRDRERLCRACTRLTKAIQALGGDQYKEFAV